MLNADIALAGRLLDALQEASVDEPGITRDAYGKGEEAAHTIVLKEAERLGLITTRDAAGNLFMTWPGEHRERAPWIVGSHLDSVPHGGNFDGAAGVVAGLAAVSALKAAGLKPPRPIIVLAIRAEESTWFPTSYIGSRAAFGQLEPSALDLLRADSGRTLAEHMHALGFDAEAVRRGECSIRKGTIHGYVEIHIEQGPTLELDNAPIGLVSGISGSFRYRAAKCLGVYGHSGAVPRRHRRDAFMALAELAMKLDCFWEENETPDAPLTITFGQVTTDPVQHAFSKVPGEVGFSLDVRSTAPALLERADTALMKFAAEIEARRGVHFDWGPRSGSTPAVMDAGILGLLELIAGQRGVLAPRLPSGAGHDAAVFSANGIPSAMIFVRNQNGSHNPDEAMRLEDLEVAATMLAQLLMAEAVK
ncbi:Zn-dependent hydrolase [Mesorhizobium sp. M7D.F.Ca.US.004.01.2.1]|uniref:Zn-dependent hydrolase n=3 Tax=unclassified Mesorhizobium TaxID=325217 RepID=UPI000FCC697E|nr:Zn-dependent hydrolase [Mesorhizobium sp. M7D.F.Ca.US.004.01.2.1]RUX88547.1 hydantoinase/carbamoylase family amidase [Mesorhizobium sp. M7D.F.Ca.US.004.01.2.1]